MSEKRRKPQTQLRLTKDGRKLLLLLAKDMGITYNAVVELALRDLARTRGLNVSKEAT